MLKKKKNSPELKKHSWQTFRFRVSDQLFIESNNHVTLLSLYLQVDNLKEGTFYEFKVQAANLAGVGVPSAPSTPMKCEAWTMEEPGRRTITASQMI